jgi:glycosyltransferase involved in cell wall biosynthesis
MKIIFVPHLPTLYGRRFSLSKSLVQADNEVHFIIWDLPYPLKPSEILHHIATSWRKQTYIKDGVVIHKIRRLPFFWPIINGVLFKIQLRKIFNKLQADVIISQAYTNETTPPNGVPVIYDLNDDHLAFAQEYGSLLYKLSFILLGVRRTIDKQCKNALAITVVSKTLYKKVKQYEKPVLLLPNGVDSEVVRKILSKAQLKDSRNKILYVSTFGKWSQIIPLIHTVDVLKDSIPDVLLLLVGDGTELHEAQNLVSKLRLDSYIKFMGRINDRKQLFNIINGCDVCLNISEKNTFRDSASPIKVFEYSALGKKVVSSNLAEVSSLDLPNIFIYKNDPEQVNLKRAIVKALNARIDSKKVQERVLKEYSWHGLTNQLSKVIQDNVQS